MALWSKVQQLHGDALQQVGLAYGENFPIDVRCALAHWIEEQRWNDVDVDNPLHVTYASQLVNTLIQELESKVSSEQDFLMRLKLQEAASDFRARYSNRPAHLVRIIKHCLNTEVRIVQQAENFYSGLSNHLMITPDSVQQINIQLDKLKIKTQETQEDLRQMQQGQEALVIQFQENYRRHGHLQQLASNSSSNVELVNKLQREKDLIDRALGQKCADLIALRMKCVEKYHETFIELTKLQKHILDTELIRWKRGQQLAGNGVSFENNLDQIQEWCEALADIIWQNRQQIKQGEHLCKEAPLEKGDIHNKFSELNQQITGLLSSLVTSTFIIEKQPPQVMKTNTRFTAVVRLLVGSKLSVYMTPPQVKVTIISEVQAIALLKNDKVGPGEASGDILNNVGTMEYHQATRQLSVNFRNMQLRKIKRAEKKGTESVMDEKFSLLFQSQFKVGGGELVFQVWTLSLPVVVIVHGNQEPHAWATVTWDNAFAEPGRVPFQVPERVAWSEMGEVLSTKFRQATGCGLNEDNLQFLAGKVFRSAGLLDNSSMLSWSQFCKEPLPERGFTFWEWFYAIMKTTKEYLRGPWNDSLIIGFVGRHQTEELLLKRCNGTFLLRFSDSELGGITIAWVTDAQQREGQEVFMIQPFTGRDFGIRSLADRISDLNNLLYLYPDIPKDQAFGKYYTIDSPNNMAPTNGYVKSIVVTHIPMWSSASGVDGCPTTPLSMMHGPQSPDPNYHDMHSSSDQLMFVFDERHEEDDCINYNLEQICELGDLVGSFPVISVNDLNELLAHS